MNHYTRALAELKSKPAHKLSEVGDQWQTPPALFWGINAVFGPFIIDLFTDGENSKCPRFYTADNNALLQDWTADLAGGKAFANPPYSRISYDDDKQAITGMRSIIAKVMAERDKGAKVVLLLKSATSEVWWPEEADHIAFVRGRISFDLPEWFVPASDKDKASSAGFAVTICVFDKQWRGQPMQYIERTTLLAQGNAIIDMIEQRASELAAEQVKGIVDGSIELVIKDAEPSEQVSGEPLDNSEQLERVLDPVCPNCGQNCNDVELAGFRTFCQPCFDKLPAFPTDGRGYNPEQQQDGSWHWVTNEPEPVLAEDATALPSKFSVDEIAECILDDRLPFDGPPMAVTIKLYEMFGQHEVYTLRQVRTALIALEEPEMVTKNEPAPEPEQVEQKHTWPSEVLTVLGNALIKHPVKLQKAMREEICEQINRKILLGCSKADAIEMALELVKGSESCAA